MLDINLSTRVYIDKRRLSQVLGLCVCAALLFIGGNLWFLWVQYQELTRIESNMRASAEKMSKGSRTIAEKDFQQLQENIRFANGMLQRRGQFWLQMLDRLEQVVPDGVMLTSVDPDRQSASAIKISGMALDFRKVRLLYETMGSSALFTDVFLVSQTRAKVTENQEGVTFTLTAKVSP